MDRVSEWVDRHPIAVCSIVLAVYAAITCAAAAIRQLWYDELVTWYVARLPDWAAIWAALERGVDQSLPVLHASVRASQWLFGYGELATRLPSIIGFGVLCCCLFVFLHRRMPTVFALTGMLFPLISYAWLYAFEARSYGLLLGGAAFSFLCWQFAADGVRRRLTLPGITIGMLIALLTNMMAVLIAIPFVLGELTRTIVRRRVDAGVWLAFAAALPAAFVYAVILRATKTWAHDFPADLLSIPWFFQTILQQASLPCLIALILVCVQTIRPRQDQRTGERPNSNVRMPMHEIAALLGFVFAPVVFVLVSRISGHFFFIPRYGLPAIIGVSGFIALGVERLANSSKRIGVIVAIVWLGWFAVYGCRMAFVRSLGMPGAPEAPIEQRKDISSVVSTGTPIVITSPHYFLAAVHYLPYSDVKNYRYLLDSRKSSAFTHDLINHLYMAFAQTFDTPAGIVDADAFLSGNPRVFVAVQSGSDSLWLLARLREYGYTINVRSDKGDNRIYEAIRSGAQRQ